MNNFPRNKYTWNIITDIRVFGFRRSQFLKFTPGLHDKTLSHGFWNGFCCSARLSFVSFILPVCAQQLKKVKFESINWSFIPYNQSPTLYSISSCIKDRACDSPFLPPQTTLTSFLKIYSTFGILPSISILAIFYPLRYTQGLTQ